MTTARFHRGLVVGKFAPLHLGHELVLQTCEQQCDETVIVSWSVPELPGCEPRRRRAWLAALHPRATRLVVDDEWLDEWARARPDEMTPRLPANEDPERDHRRFVGWLCTRVLGVEVDAVFTSEAYGPGFADELGRWFAAETGRREPVVHVSVDIDRLAVPISGTQVRADPLAHLDWLPAPVAASFTSRATNDDPAPRI